jgi:site-specific DNA-methyltransferase (adenine-specific)
MLGRWPANLIHDGSDEVVGLFPQSKSTGGQASIGAFRNGDVYGKGRDEREARDPGYGDTGSAARFFYCAKASRNDRNRGCEGMLQQMPKAANGAENAVSANRGSLSKPRENHHPTVKPTDLMRYLCRLVTPPGGVILDPFMGSGSTGVAAIAEGFGFIGIEREAEYVEIARARIEAADPSRGTLFKGTL